MFSNLSRHSIPVTLNFFEKKFFVLFFPKRLWFLSNPKYLQSISHLQSFHRSRFEIMTVDQTCLQQFVTLNSCYSLIFKFLRHLAPPTFSLKITKKKRIHWLDRRIVRKQLDIMLTYHYVQNQGKLMMQSWENFQKPQFGQFLTISRPSISKLRIFLKNRFHLNWRWYLVLTSGQKPEKPLEPFLRKI